MAQFIVFGCSFERYNGILGNYKTNQRSVELQIMRRFTSELQIYDMAVPDDDCDVSKDSLDFLLESDCAGTLKDLTSSHSAKFFDIIQASACSLLDYPTEFWSIIEPYQPGGVMSAEILDEPELSYLAQCYCKMW